MIKIRIKAGMAGLVYRRGALHSVLGQGTHWVGLLDEVFVYAKDHEFLPGRSQHVLMLNPQLATTLLLIEIAGTETVLVYESGDVSRISMPADSVFWKGAAGKLPSENETTDGSITRLRRVTIPARRELVPA